MKSGESSELSKIVTNIIISVIRTTRMSVNIKMRSHWLVSRFALSGMDMSCKNYDNRTALHVAATQGHLNIVKFLVEKCSVAHDMKDRYAIQSGSPYPILVIRVILAIPSGSVHVNPILAIPSVSANAGLPTFSQLFPLKMFENTVHFLSQIVQFKEIRYETDEKKYLSIELSKNAWAYNFTYLGIS